MKHVIALCISVGLAASPVLAQDRKDPEDPQGRSLMEQGMQLFFEGLREEMSPALRDLQGLTEQFGPSMRGFLAEMGPAFAKMLDEVKDWSRYHPPEILPNGDIIIRRKPAPDPKPVPEQDAPAGPTDI